MKLYGLVSLLLFASAAFASVGEIEFSFTDSGGDVYDYYPVDFDGLVVLRAEVEDNAYNDWLASNEKHTLACIFYSADGRQYPTPSVWIGCQPNPANPQFKDCHPYVAFDFDSDLARGGRVSCTADGLKVFDEEIQFGAPAPPPPPPQDPGTQDPGTQDPGTDPGTQDPGTGTPDPGTQPPPPPANGGSQPPAPGNGQNVAPEAQDVPCAVVALILLLAFSAGVKR